MKKKKGPARSAPRRGRERTWSSLTWTDLDDWAGSRAVSRGRSYHRRGTVHDLGISPEGELVAWVVGRSRYATRVRCSPPRTGRRGVCRLESSCSCPVGAGCKHAVAAVVAALDEIEAGKALPRAAADDIRWALAAGDVGSGVLESTPQPSDLAPFLRSLEKTQLVELFLQISALHPEVEADLVHRRALSGGDVAAIVQRIREEIAVASAQEAWSSGWGEEGSTPD